MNEEIVGKLYFYDEEDLQLALDGAKWKAALADITMWLNDKTKYDFVVEGEIEDMREMEAYDTVSDYILDILEGRGLKIN